MPRAASIRAATAVRRPPTRSPSRNLPAAGSPNNNFGERVGSIAGSVFLDANDDGIRQGGDSAIAGVSVTLTGTDANGATFNRTTTTDASRATTASPTCWPAATPSPNRPRSRWWAAVTTLNGITTAGSSGGTATPPWPCTPSAISAASRWRPACRLRRQQLRRDSAGGRLGHGVHRRRQQRRAEPAGRHRAAGRDASSSPAPTTPVPPVTRNGHHRQPTAATAVARPAPRHLHRSPSRRSPPAPVERPDRRRAAAGGTATRQCQSRPAAISTAWC